MDVISLVVVVCWVAFWIFWLVASVGVKTGNNRWTRFAGIRVAAVVLVVYLLHLRLFRSARATASPLPQVIGGATDRPLLQGIGLAVFALGLGLAIWARIYIGRNWGTPMSRKDDPELVTTGPYHTIRHPIYTGIIIAMIGTALAVGWYWIIAAAVLTVYFIVSAVTEERYLAESFPESYPQYKHSTKMLIPFIL
jgi:protein-S-isoprenylcysteine O-methyltransferase Ste14